MSVRTTASEKLDEARKHLVAAQKAIAEVLIPDTWGLSDYDDAYIDFLHETVQKLQTINRKI